MHKKDFSAALLPWFKKSMRPLPWRESCEPYEIWISEIMLQQTQMERGVEYFNKWMIRFPDVRSVAQADETAILAAWEGLGYYSRARNLHKAAKTIMEKHGGVFPESHADIRALPGVGDYTAGAIASIAFNAPHPAVDANVLRIFSRLRDMASPVEAAETKAEITKQVQSLTPETKAREFCQALMELGALVCAKTPRCEKCPVKRFCLSLQNGTTGERPVKKPAAEYKRLETAAAVMVRVNASNEEVFIRQRPPGGLWANLWEFPGDTVEKGESPEQALARCLGESPKRLEKIGTVQHGYTVWRVTLHGFLLRMEKDAGTPPPAETKEGKWIPREMLAEYAFPAGRGRAVFLDVATSTAALSKVFRAAEGGEMLPDGWIVDRQGLPTNDPRSPDFSLSPFGGHKGYGIAVGIEILTGVLSGGGFLSSVHEWFDDLEQRNNCCHAFVVFDVEAIAGPGRFRERLDKMIDEIHNEPKAEGAERIYLPGEMELDNQARARQEGLELLDPHLNRLTELSRMLELPIEEIFI